MGEKAPPCSRAKVSPITYAAPTSGWARKLKREKSTNFDLKNWLVVLVSLQMAPISPQIFEPQRQVVRRRHTISITGTFLFSVSTWHLST